MPYIPTREDLIAKLDGLCNGTESRDEVVRWADAIYLDDNLKIEDEAVRQVLGWLGMIKAPEIVREYLYNESDFKAWKAELLNWPST